MPIRGSRACRTLHHRAARTAIVFADLTILSQKYGSALAAMPGGANTLAAGTNTASTIGMNFTAPIDPSTGIASTLFTGFRVYRSTNGLDFTQVSSDTDTTLLRDGSPVYSWTDNAALVDGTKYWYRVRPYNTDATNGAPTGDWHTTNKVWSVTTLPAPTSPAAARTNTTTASITWVDESTTETSFQIQRARNSTFTSGVTTFTAAGSSGTGTTRTYTDAAATGPGTYYYRVRAVNSVQQSAYTLPVSVTPTPENHAPVISGTTPTSMQVSPLDGFPSTLTLPATIRDFHPSSSAHPNDFQVGGYGLSGLVSPTLGTDGTPTLVGNSGQLGTAGIRDAASFYEWFHDVPATGGNPARNITDTIALPFTLMPPAPSDTVVFNLGSGATPVYHFEPVGQVDGTGHSQFLPINGRLFGNEDPNDDKNGNFTLEMHTSFTYRANPADPPRFDFTGDDDVWVFINGTLALDMGGIHTRASDSIILDAATATTLGLVDGQTYPFDFFFAERFMGGSHLEADTSIPIFGNYDYMATLAATDIDPYDTLTWVVMEPQNATITPREGFSPLASDLHYTPTSDDLGTTKHFKVAVTDGHGGLDMKEWDVAFNSATNHLPYLLDPLDAPAPLTPGVAFSWDVSPYFADLDADLLTYLPSGASPLPDGMALSSSGLFMWTPPVAAEGLFPTQFLVSDGAGGVISVNVTFSVQSAPISISVVEGTTSDLPSIPQDADRQAALYGGEAYTFEKILNGGQLSKITYVTPEQDGPAQVVGVDFVFRENVTGDISVSCYTPTILLFKTEYLLNNAIVGTEYVAVTSDLGLANSSPTEIVVQKKRRILAENKYDLRLISSGPDPDPDEPSFLQNARKLWPNAFPMNNVEEAVHTILAVAFLWAFYSYEVGGPNIDQVFDVSIVDHGRNGRAGFGGGGLENPPAGKYVSKADPSSLANYVSYFNDYDFGDLNISEIIHSITFTQCRVAGNDIVGRPFIRALAVDTGITHLAYQDDVWIDPTPGAIYFFTESSNRLWTATPDGQTIPSALP